MKIFHDTENNSGPALPTLTGKNYGKIRKLWNILTGKDLNRDGKVDIKDKFIKAENKAAKEIDNFKPQKAE